MDSGWLVVPKHPLAIPTTLALRRNKTNNNPSIVFNPVSLTSGNGASGGDYSDLVHCCAEFVALGLRVLSVGE